MGVDTAGMDQAVYRKAAVDAVRSLSQDVGIPSRLEALKEEDLDFLSILKIVKSLNSTPIIKVSLTASM